MAWSYANLEAIADGIAYACKQTDTHVTALETCQGTMATRIDGLAAEAYEAGLTEATYNATKEASTLKYRFYGQLVKKLCNTVFKETGYDLATWWADNQTDATHRVDQYFADMARNVAGANIPATLVAPAEDSVDFGNYDCSTTTFTDDSAVETDLYGGAVLKTVVTTQIDAAADAVVTITGTDENGLPWTGTVTIAQGDGIGTEDTVTPDVAGTYCADVTSVSHTGATTGAFDIFPAEARALSA